MIGDAKQERRNTIQKKEKSLIKKGLHAETLPNKKK